MEATQLATFEMANDFPVSVKKLYEAWVTEDALRQWWKPNGNTLKSLVNDIREGGEVKYEFAEDGGTIVFVISGTYEVAKPEQQLVYTWNWKVPAEPVRDAEYKLHITFSGDENSSHLNVKQEGFQDDEAIVPHKEGWEKGLRDLETYLSGKE
jgi:uncharacterized protein YndB with AHSA1/START domain